MAWTQKHLAYGVLALFLALVANVSLGLAQDAPTAGPLAARLLTITAPEPEEAELFTGPTPLTEIPVSIENLEYTPNFESKSQTVFEMAKKVILRRPIWNLEFAFKPLRMVVVEVPTKSGRLEERRVWYLVYRVTNRGDQWAPKAQQTAGVTTFTREVNPVEISFFPKFVLRSHEQDKEYVDQVIPSAIPLIEAREKIRARTKKPISDSISISGSKIKPIKKDEEGGVWGVAMWDNVDPRSDFLSVYVEGLTNAFRFAETPGAFKRGSRPGTGRTYQYKNLQLNFWRAGDTIDENEKEIFFGIPIDKDEAEQAKILSKFNLKERLDYLWVYR